MGILCVLALVFRPSVVRFSGVYDQALFVRSFFWCGEGPESSFSPLSGRHHKARNNPQAIMITVGVNNTMYPQRETMKWANRIARVCVKNVDCI